MATNISQPNTFCITTMSAAAGRGRKQHQEDSNVLPQGFVPAATQVICGRSSLPQHPGNTWCRHLVKVELTKYHVAGLSRKDKTELVTCVVAQVRARNHDRIGFIKRDPQSGRWYKLSSSQARRKVLEILQEMLSDRQANERNANFLGEYVARQTAALGNKQKPPSHMLGTTSGNLRRNERRENVELPTWPARQPQVPQQEPAAGLEDLSFQRFLRNFAASIPDNVGATNDPFEPNPLPRKKDSSQENNKKWR